MIRIFAHLLGLVGGSMAAPLLVALFCGERAAAVAFAVPMAAGLAAAAALSWTRREPMPAIDTRNAFGIVGGVWTSIGLFGAIPFWLCGAFPSFADAVFESVSGFTTTGASVLSDVETLPRSILLWRCQTHWLGGLGVVVLVVALLPLLGIGGFRLVKAETSGPEKGRLTARIANTAKVLWLLYCGMTLVQTALLRLSGMRWLDAVCHAFSTMGTGGFSTRNASVGAFGNPAAEWICIVFMLAASVNFALYYQLLHGRRASVLRNSELRAFAGIAGGAILCAAVLRAGAHPSFATTLRHSAFQVSSILSTTGFMTEDYVRWCPSAQTVLLALFLIGGCSGSTAGGVKVVRWTVLAKSLANEFRLLAHPRAVFTIRLNGQAGRDDLCPPVAAFLLAYLLLVLATTLAGAFAGLAPFDALTGALSMVGNVGPAFGRLGPTENYGFLPAALKWWYCFAMLAGRLEIYTMLFLAGRIFLPWRSRT